MILTSRVALAAARMVWAIDETWLPVLLDIADRRDLTGRDDLPEAVAARVGTRLDNTRSVEVRDGVAVVPVMGPIFRYGNLFTEVSGATSLAQLAKDFSTALNDPAVSAIVLNVDSPGGQASGIAEFAAMVHQARGVKPVTAYVSDYGASAAYWIAAAAGDVVVAETASLGSIGCVTTMAAPTAEGSAKVLEFVSSQSPNKRPDLATEAGRAEIQSRVDTLAGIFIDAVARYRGLDGADAVVAAGNRGGLRIGADAVAAGLADRVGSFEGVLASLAARRSPRPSLPSSTPKAEATMDLSTLDAATLTAQRPDLATALRADGAAAERARLAGIDAAAAGYTKGNEELIASLKADPTKGPGDAAVAILAAERAKGPKVLEQMRADETGAAKPPAAPNAAPGTPDTGAATTPEEKQRARWDGDANLRAEFGGDFAVFQAYEAAAAKGRVKVLGAKR